MKIKKVTYTFEVLMEVDDSHDVPMEAIVYESQGGSWSKIETGQEVEILEGKEAIQKECDKQGTDIEFFFPELEN